MGHSFTWFDLFPKFVSEYFYISGSLLVSLVLISLAILAYREFSLQEVIPKGRFSFATPFELVGDFLLGLMRDVIGEGSEKYLPFVGALFVYILANNILGLVPGFLPPTESLNTNLACAIVVFVLTQYYGFKAHGMGYLKHFKAPLAGVAGILLSFLFVPIEVFGQFMRVGSLSLRLWGNMMGDHMALEIFSSITPWLVPVFFMCLGLFVCVMQAFIFSMLAIIYIRLATAHAH